MKTPGQVVVFRFPQTDLTAGKIRPAIVLGKVPGKYDDWLVCMISSQIRHYIAGFDEIVKTEDDDFDSSGLKVTSVIRTARLAVVGEETLLGTIGQISALRLQRLKRNLSAWLLA